jgi:hypothetical protein
MPPTPTTRSMAYFPASTVPVPVNSLRCANAFGMAPNPLAPPRAGGPRPLSRRANSRETRAAFARVVLGRQCGGRNVDCARLVVVLLKHVGRGSEPQSGRGLRLADPLNGSTPAPSRHGTSPSKPYKCILFHQAYEQASQIFPRKRNRLCNEPMARVAQDQRALGRGSNQIGLPPGPAHRSSTWGALARLLLRDALHQ